MTLQAFPTHSAIMLFQEFVSASRIAQEFNNLAALTDPVNQFTLQEEEDIIRNCPETFKETLSRVQETVKNYKLSLLFTWPEGYKQSLCERADHYLKLGVPSPTRLICNNAHSYVPYIAFNLVGTPNFKSRICTWHHANNQDRSTCPRVHPGDPYHVLDGGKWRIYSPSDASKPDHNGAVRGPHFALSLPRKAKPPTGAALLDGLVQLTDKPPGFSIKLDRLVQLTDKPPRFSIGIEKKLIKADPEGFNACLQQITNRIQDCFTPIREYFRHSYKTVLCKSGQNCSQGTQCNFAHSLIAWIAYNIFQKPSFKTAICNRSPCPYLANKTCHYVHPGDPYHMIEPGVDRWEVYSPNKEPASDADCLDAVWELWKSTIPAQEAALLESSEDSENQLLNDAINAYSA